MKSIGSTLAGLATGLFVLVGLASGIGILFFTGAYLGFVAQYVLPFINVIALIGIAASVLLGLPFLMFRKMGETAEVIFSSTAMVVGFSIALWSLILVYAAWGKFWTLVILVFMPVLPLMAAIAHGFAGHWDVVGMLALNVLVWVLLVAGASYAASKR